LESFDFTLIRWTGTNLDPRFDYFFPEKEKFLPALFSLGIRAKVLDTRKWNKDENPFEKIVREIKTKKILLTLSEWVARKDIENLLKFVKKEKKELYVLVQAEENKKVNDVLGKVGLYSKKIFVTLENYKKKFKKEYPQFSEKIIVLPYPVCRGRIYSKQEARTILGIKTPYVLICWGCPRKVKQFDKVLDWVKDWEDTTLLFAGTLEVRSRHRDYYNFLKKYVKEEGLEERVFFAEPLITHEDVDIWFSAADLKVYPHKSYACASVTYAIGHGKCVVTNSHPNFLELSKETGIVPTEDYKTTIRKLLENPKEREKQERKSFEYSRKWNWFEWTKKLVKELNISIKKPPKVAVIIPVKNVESFIIRHLENWKNLCYPKDRFRLYFMDGYSTDRTRELIEKYCKENKINYEIHLEPKYDNPINASGWIAETMKAFRKYLKDEEYVAIVDADIVYWNPFLLGQLLVENVDIIAPYVYTEPTDQLKYDTKSAATRYFYDCTLFRKDNYLFPKKVFWKQIKGLIEMDSVGSFVLVKREVYDNCYWDNPLPTLQFLLDARKLGYRIWTKPRARVFHRYFTNGHKSIEQHVKEGTLPKSALLKLPQTLGFLPPEKGEKLPAEKIYTWKELKPKPKKVCPACLSRNLFIEHGRVWCRGCGCFLGTDVRKYFPKPNVLIIILNSLGYDYFMQSKIPRIFEKGMIFKCLLNNMKQEEVAFALLTGLKEKNNLQNNKPLTAWKILGAKSYNLGFINSRSGKKPELKERELGLSYLGSFPKMKNLKTLLAKEPFFGILYLKPSQKTHQDKIRAFEKEMGRLKESLKERNLLKRTLIVITSDYGESKYRKSERNIPLLFYHPSFSRVLLGTCKPEDILPSILKLIGIKISSKFEGKLII